MEEEERMWMMAAAAGFSGTLILGLLLYRERLKGKRLVERKKELEEELRKAENEAERIKEAEACLSKRVSELEKKPGGPEKGTEGDLRGGGQRTPICPAGRRKGRLQGA